MSVVPGLSRILITGASGAIGGALAEIYAEPGVRLFLHGRNRAQLAQLAERCQGLGATVTLLEGDVRNVAVEHLKHLPESEVFDLVICNAGVNTNIGDGQGETWEATEALVDTNLKATMAVVHAVLPAMRRRGHGQIALVSSLAAYYGLPVTPAYCASKAGVKAYGEALRGWLAPEGVKVNVIMPGYVQSKMCDGMPGPKPFMISPERASRLIRRGLARNKARISFPFPLNLGTWFLGALPAALSQWIVCLLGYRDQRGVR